MTQKRRVRIRKISQIYSKEIKNLTKVVNDTIPEKYKEKDRLLVYRKEASWVGERGRKTCPKSKLGTLVRTDYSLTLRESPQLTLASKPVVSFGETDLLGG